MRDVSWLGRLGSSWTRAPTAARGDSSGQMAAMHACGPYVIEHVFVEAFLNYTNQQPSGSVRAPTAPQVCWGLEQHMDEVAGALDLDPVELRRRTLIEEGAEGPTRQVFDAIGIKQTLERAVEMIGYDRELPDDEAIGVAVGWWPSSAAPSGAYIHLNGDGSGTIVTGAQENGSGAVMAMPVFVAEELGMRPEDFTLLYQDTAAANSDMGSCGSQTTFNSGRAILAAAADAREQLLDAGGGGARGRPRRPGARRRPGPGEGIAGALRVDRGPGRGGHDPREGIGRGPRGTDRRHGGVRRAAGERDLPGSATDHAGRAREGGSRDRRRPRAPGGRRPRLGCDPQPDRRGRAGDRRRRDGRRTRALGGHPARRARAASGIRTCSTTSSSRAPTHRRSRSTGCRSRPRERARAARRASANPRRSPPPAAIANAITKVLGRQVRHLPMTPERVWAASRRVDA